MNSEKKFFSALRRSSGEIKRYRTYHRIIPVAIGVIVSFLVILYVVSLLFNKFGSFTVTVENPQNRGYALSLCEDETFKKPTSRLNTNVMKEISNIDGNTLPANVADGNGDHSGKNYVAYSFYVKNTGTAICTYSYDLLISRATLNVDAAARVRVYYNPYYYRADTDTTTLNSVDYTDYAKVQTGTENGSETTPDPTKIVNFLNSGLVMTGTITDFAPGDISRYTIVVWLEGNDPDCTDDVIGGELKFDMEISIVGMGDDEETDAA